MFPADKTASRDRSVITWLVGVAELALAAASFAAIVFLAARSAIAGVVIAVGTFILFEATAPRLLDLVVQFGSVSVYPIDVVSLALLSVGTWRLVSQQIYGPAKLALVTMVVLLVANLIWGIADFGLEQATNSSRFWMSIVSGVVYGATVRSWDRRLPTVFIVAGCFLAALSIFRVLQHGLYAANTTLIDRAGNPVDARPVMALGVLVMLEGLILLVARRSFTLATAGAAALLASGIVLLQYRTLWVAAIAAAMLGAFALAARYRVANERAVYRFTAVTLLVVPALLFAISQVSVYQQSAESATGASSTLTWRIEAWMALLEKHSSPLDLMFGTPSGTGREIVVSGWATNLSAHNLYVEAILQYGLVGLVALCALAVLALKSRHASARQLEIAVPAIVVLIVTWLLVSMTHSPDQVQGLLLGVLISVACFQPQSSLERHRITVPRRELAASR